MKYVKNVCIIYMFKKGIERLIKKDKKLSKLIHQKLKNKNSLKLTIELLIKKTKKRKCKK